MFVENNTICNDNYHKKECLCCGSVKVLPDGNWCEECLVEFENFSVGEVESEIVKLVDPIYARILERDSNVYYDGTPKPWTANW